MTTTAQSSRNSAAEGKAVTERGVSRSLERALIRIQASKDLDFLPACEEAARILLEKEEEFERRVKVKAEEIYKSRFLTQWNKAKAKVEQDGLERGRAGSHYVNSFTTRCGRCRKDIHWQPSEPAQRKIILSLLEKAGINAYTHADCEQALATTT